MMNKPPRLLAFVSLLVFAAALVLILYSHKKPSNETMDFSKFPTIGSRKAKVHVVVFEEPFCIHCKEYNIDIYPEISKNYIQTGKIRYTMIPLSFLPSSMETAIAWMCVYHQSTSKFFAFVEGSYRLNTEGNMDLLLHLARSLDLNTPALKKCITSEQYLHEVERNNTFGKKLMSGTLSSPVVYINNEEVSSINYESISKKIEEQLKQL